MCENFNGVDTPFCCIYSKHCDSDSQFFSVRVYSFLFVYFNRLLHQIVQFLKDSPVTVNPSIWVLIEVNEEVSYRKTLDIVEIINYSGGVIRPVSLEKRNAGCIDRHSCGYVECHVEFDP